ncbi:MAG: ATP-binding cassette domain-containing protein [Caldilineaceae bacterium]
MAAIQVRGAREHNLQNIDVTFGPGLTVVTGVSGSGKTSLVFDTLYHEAERRFMAIYGLGAAGQRLAPANVTSITGLGPAMAVGQNLLNRNPLSTLATASGLHPFLRLLYARYGARHCAHCATPLTLLTIDEILEQVAEIAQQRSLTLYAPLVQGVVGSHHTLLTYLAATFDMTALLVDGQPWQGQRLNATSHHTIEVVLAELDGTTPLTALRQAVEAAGALGATALLLRAAGMAPVTLAWAPVCTHCGAWFDELEPTHFHTPCSHCDGIGCAQCAQSGLHPQAAAVRWRGLRLPELLALSVQAARARFAHSPGVVDELPASADRLHREISRRLNALMQVGLGYLTLDRTAPTLSRGEAQRVRLAITLTSRLEDMLHVLDEPTVGQHPADVARLLPSFRELAGPVVFVEHDRIAAAAADQALDLGPGAGRNGGQLLFSGTPAALWQADTPSGRYFSLHARVPIPAPRPVPEEFLTIQGAQLRTLQDLHVPIPIGRLTVVTGVSGSGKSTLVRDVLAASLNAGRAVGCAALEGPDLKGVLVDQSPIGLNPRSNPATYTKLADILRDHFAAATGLTPSHFSFNRPEGACPTCEGMGAVEVRMRYLPSTWMPCSACDGQRFSEEVLAARAPLGGRLLSIADLYACAIDEIMGLLVDSDVLASAQQRAAERILEALCDVGLGYLSLGQPSPTLSGGEAQRVKLAKYLSRRSLANQLLILDEPSTGLHPQDVAGLLTIFDRLVRAGATIVVVEHNTDIMRAADWIIDLGPGAGPDGGQLLYAGEPEGLLEVAASATGQALREERALQPTAAPSAHEGNDKGARYIPADQIEIHEARAHNLKNVSVAIPKGALTVVTGLSGSGKSSLVHDVLEAEARRRYLETLSLYERQSTREGPEAPVGGVTGLGVALSVGPERRLYQRRATVGVATEIAHHLAVLLATQGERTCLRCGNAMVRLGTTPQDGWRCSHCQATAPPAYPRHFSPNVYAAACLTCSGVGSLQAPEPAKLIVAPEQPLCGGAMYSPGFFPQGFLCKPYNSGYDIIQALAARYGFDPATTPWQAMSEAAQQAFLFGDREPLTVTFASRTGRTQTREVHFNGFYGWVRDWDVGGTYTRTEPCPTCHGGRLRPEYLAVTWQGRNLQQLSELPLATLATLVDDAAALQATTNSAGAPRSAQLTTGHLSLTTIRERLHFLCQVGLGYLHLNRVAATLSAGEAQRVKLAGLLGSGLTALTVLLDEPSRGLHPREVDALLAALLQLRDEGNTVIVVEHDPLIMHAADHLIDMGPGAGTAGGEVVAQGAPDVVMQANTATAHWLRHEITIKLPPTRRTPRAWLTLQGARENNLCGEDVALPLGVLVGLCGVSGSGKSTLLIDTLGRALAPKQHTTSVAREPLVPGAHDAILNAPDRTVVVDQARAGVTNPADFLGLSKVLRQRYAASEDAQALGLTEAQLARGCSACKGNGALKVDMGFLPDIYTPCDTCQGTGFLPEAWQVRLQGLALPDLFGLTLDELSARFSDDPALAAPLQRAHEVGLGYLVLRQPGHTLSGGEAQRLKLVKELCHPRRAETLYILDEPTVGQHLSDVARLIGVLHTLVDGGHTVAVVEHHPHLLASCDWLIELGPGGGPDGGRVIASGTPPAVAAGATPTAPYLQAILEASR